MSGYALISIDEAIRLLQQESAILVDIRDEQSFSQYHVKMAIHLSQHNLSEVLAGFEYDTPILVLCYHGNSSQSAANYIAQQGFEHVYSVNGGITEWAESHPDMLEMPH